MLIRGSNSLMLDQSLPTNLLFYKKKIDLLLKTAINPPQV